MNICVDLHSHSGYAGGVGDIRLEDISQTMRFKGIDVFGTGDCLLPKRTEELKHLLPVSHHGLFRLSEDDKSSFLLQTEIILTVSLPDYKNKIIAHHIILFPDFITVQKCSALMDKWGQKNTIGRPFVVCRSGKELEDRLFEIQNLHKEIEIIPAHILTPDGLMGSKNMLKHIGEFYGDFKSHIHALETGLSADPPMLSQIPELSKLTMLSFSDCHSSALNRVGREFTVLDCYELSYSSIIQSIRNNKIVFTAEFNPDEGRYHLTGHRSDRHHDKQSICFESDIPSDLICPLCGKKMTLGVKNRWEMLRTEQNTIPKHKHLIPLIDVIAVSLHCRSIDSVKVTKPYYAIIRAFGTELSLWLAQDDIIQDKLSPILENGLIQSIIAVKNGFFSYNPPGFDGQYGQLQINR